MSEVTTPKTLEERVTARLHESIGDLITDDDLRSIVERGIEKALFQKRETQRQTSGSWGTTYIDTHPPLVDDLVERLLSRKMTEAVDGWLREHPEQLQAAIDQAIQDGAAAAMMGALNRQFASVFTAGVEQLQNMNLLPRQSGC